jgi:hypothetical protein
MMLRTYGWEWRYTVKYIHRNVDNSIEAERRTIDYRKHSLVREPRVFDSSSLVLRACLRVRICTYNHRDRPVSFGLHDYLAFSAS